MPINLSGAFTNIDSTLNNLLSKYSRMRFIGFDQAQDNKRVYLTQFITKGFYYKAVKRPITGELVERLRVVPQDSTVETVLKTQGTMVELSDLNGNFVRFKIKVLRQPNPPTFEWHLEINPNIDDINTI